MSENKSEHEDEYSDQRRADSDFVVQVGPAHDSETYCTNELTFDSPDRAASAASIGDAEPIPHRARLAR